MQCTAEGPEHDLQLHDRWHYSHFRGQTSAFASRLLCTRRLANTTAEAYAIHYPEVYFPPTLHTVIAPESVPSSYDPGCLVSKIQGIT
jgi:hypothetical protein